MSLATGNEIIVVLAAWSIVKVVLGSWPSKLVCWTLIKKDKALVSCFCSLEPGAGVFLLWFALQNSHKEESSPTDQVRRMPVPASYRRASSWKAEAKKWHVKFWQIRMGNISDSEPLLKSRNYTDLRKWYRNLKCLSNYSHSAKL